MKLGRILFATDFSTAGEGALEMATVLARATGAQLLIVHVDEPPMAYGYGTAFYGVVEPAADEQLGRLESLVPSDPAVKYEHRLISGAPADALVKMAEQEHVDLIVMGTHGRTGLSRALMGSVAEHVVRHSTCPVLTFKQPQPTTG